MSELIDRLNSSKDTVSNLELLDYVIAFQISKIENYHSRSLHQTERTVNEDAENSMANLIELLKLREHYKRRK